jgi:hypothetical protein
VVALVAVLGFSSCYDDYSLTTSDYDVVLTRYAPEANFSRYAYFVMPDTIIHLYDVTGPDPITRQYDRQILNLLASNFETRGFERTDTTTLNLFPARRDSVIFVLNAFTQDEITEYYYYDYWYGWYPYYPYYPVYGGSVTYTQGTLIVSVVHPSAGEQRVNGQWLGVVAGLAEGSAAEIQSRLNTRINQLFEQSPYLVAAP